MAVAWVVARATDRVVNGWRALLFDCPRAARGGVALRVKLDLLPQTRHTRPMLNPGFKSATSLTVPSWHGGCSTLDGPDITVSGRQIPLGTLAS
jgi:hypothetical protein